MNFWNVFGVIFLLPYIKESTGEQVFLDYVLCSEKGFEDFHEVAECALWKLLGLVFKSQLFTIHINNLMRQ